jgi:hypothetical protein
VECHVDHNLIFRLLYDGWNSQHPVTKCFEAVSDVSANDNLFEKAQKIVGNTHEQKRHFRTLKVALIQAKSFFEVL